MRIVALLAMRNEALYLQRCLRHLGEQGIETCVIDNGSTDHSRDIAESFRDKGVFRIETLGYDGYFDLVAQCRLQEALAADIAADWFIHHDADEIREAPKGWGTLAEGIARADSMGANAIDFAEFVFLPESDSAPIPDDYVRDIRHYYYFQPPQPHRINAWKSLPTPVDLVSSGGHQAEFAGRQLLPQQFIMRHYIGLSLRHLQEKYVHRRYSPAELQERGWHRSRSQLATRGVVLPPSSALTVYRDDGEWDRSAPQTRHMFM